MSQKSDAEKRRVFDALHNPARPIYQVAHARRANTSEEYSSEAIRAMSTRLLPAGMETAREVFAQFSKRSKKS